MNKLQTIDIGVQNVVNLTEEQAKARYNIGRTNLRELSDRIGADVFLGRKHLYSKKKLDNYFENYAG